MGKRQAFIDLARAGGSRQDFIDLAASFKVPLDPFKALSIYDMLMSGALPSELKHGGIASLAPRSGYARGGWSPGVGRDERGYQSSHPSHRDAWKKEASKDFSQVLKTTKRREENPTQVEPIQSFTGDSNYLDQLGLQARNKNLYAAGLLSIEDVMKGDIKPDIYAGISGNNFNIEGQKTKDMTGLYGNTSIGPVNVQGSYEDFDGDVNRKVGASTQLGNFGLGVNYNFEGNPTYGASYNTDNLSGGLTYDGEPKAMFSYSKKLEPKPKYIFGKAKGGLAGLLEV